MSFRFLHCREVFSVFGLVTFRTRRHKFVIVAVKAERNDVIPMELYQLSVALKCAIRAELVPAVETAVGLLKQDSLSFINRNPPPLRSHHVNLNPNFVRIALANQQPTAGHFPINHKSVGLADQTILALNHNRAVDVASA